MKTSPGPQLEPTEDEIVSVGVTLIVGYFLFFLVILPYLRP